MNRRPSRYGSKRPPRTTGTEAVARSLTDAEFAPARADAITNAVRLAAEHGDHVTSDWFKAGLAPRSERRWVRLFFVEDFFACL